MNHIDVIPKYKCVMLNVDTRVMARVMALFKDTADICEVEEDILQLVYDTRFIVNKSGTELTLKLKEDK